MRFRAFREAGGRAGIEIQNIGEMEKTGPDQSKDGKPPRLNHLGAHSKDGLKRLPALDAEQRTGMFREKIELGFQGQAAVQVPVKAAAKSGVIGRAKVRVGQPD